MKPKANNAVTFNLIVPPYNVALGIHLKPSQVLINYILIYIASVFIIYILFIYVKVLP